MGRGPRVLITTCLVVSSACSGSTAPSTSPTSTTASAATPASTTSTAPTTSLAPTTTGVLENPATLILFNGPVVTMDPDQPEASAIALRDDVIVYLGSDEGALALRGSDTVVVELAGKAVLPGFVDAHQHGFESIFDGSEPDMFGTTYDDAQQAIVEVGITAAASLVVSPDQFVDFMAYFETNEARFRYSMYLGHMSACGGTYPPEGWYLDHGPVADPAARVRIPGVKFFMDGGSCGQIALSFPAEDPLGDLWWTGDQLAEQASHAASAGFQVAVHAVGDRAIDEALKGLESVLAGAPNTLRHRIEHARLVPPEMRPRFGELGVHPVVFGTSPACNFVDGVGWAFLADDDAPAAAIRPWLDNTRAMIDANPGLRIAGKSDAGHNRPLEPLSNVWSLVTRGAIEPDGRVCDPPPWMIEHGVTLDEALELYTINGAFVLGIDDVVGSLEVGKLGDLVILDASPYAVPTAELRNIQVLATIVGGVVEHCTPSVPALCD